MDPKDTKTSEMKNEHLNERPLFMVILGDWKSYQVRILNP